MSYLYSVTHESYKFMCYKSCTVTCSNTKALIQYKTILVCIGLMVSWPARPVVSIKLTVRKTDLQIESVFIKPPSLSLSLLLLFHLYNYIFLDTKRRVMKHGCFVSPVRRFTVSTKRYSPSKRPQSDNQVPIRGRCATVPHNRPGFALSFTPKNRLKV